MKWNILNHVSRLYKFFLIVGKNASKKNQFAWDNPDYEPQLPIYIGMNIHNLTRNKTIIG